MSVVQTDTVPAESAGEVECVRCLVVFTIFSLVGPDMRIVLLGSGSIFVNLSGSSPNLKIFEANYGLRGNNLASINSKLMKNVVNKVPF